MGFRTGVRLPSGPLLVTKTNTSPQTNFRPNAGLVVLRNVFMIIVAVDFQEKVESNTTVITFSTIQKHIKENYNVDVSKSSITQVKSKCGIQKLEFGAKCEIVPELKTEKERLVLEAFRHYGLV